MVYSIVRKHGGHVTVSSVEGEGTEFDVFLPATGAAADQAPAELRPPGGGKGRILVLDDDAMVREVAGDMLASIGYRVESVADGRDALAAWRRARDGGDPFDALLLDLTIPGGMGGEETLRELRKVDPGVRAVVSSGYSNDAVLADFESFGFRGAVVKPYRLQELADSVAGVLGGPPASGGGRDGSLPAARHG
jgi:CheY-like chemotaxis protein